MKLKVTDDERSIRMYEFVLVEDNKIIHGMKEAYSLTEARVSVLCGDYETVMDTKISKELKGNKGKKITDIHVIH